MMFSQSNLARGVLATLALSAVPALAAYDVNASLNKTGAVLALTLKDQAVSRSSCGAYVSAFRFEGDTLTLDVTANPCALDRVGRNRAKISWQLPTSIRARQRLCLVVNGEAAGVVQFDVDHAVTVAEEACR